MGRDAVRSLGLAALLCLLLAGRAVADEVRDQFAVAAAHYAAGRWELAADEFAHFLQSYPDHDRRDQVAFYLAESLVQLHRYDDARQRYQQLLADDPDGRYARQSLFRSGECAYLARNLDAARTDLAEFYHRWPDDELAAFVLPYLGELALEKGEPALAEELLAQALRKFPGSALAADSRFHLARALAAQGKVEAAEQAFAGLVEAGGARAEQAQYHRALMYYEQGRDAEAVEAWTALLDRFPGGALRKQAELGVAWGLYRQQRYSDARTRLERLVDDPRCGLEARYWLGLALRGEQQWARAAEVLLATEVGPGHDRYAAIHFHAGDSLLRNEKPDEAAEQFDQVLSAAPDGEWADDCRYGKLQIALAAKDYAEVGRQAAAFLERFEQSPLAAEVHLLHAAALRERKQFAAAVDHLEKFLARGAGDPRAGAAYLELLVCWLELNDLPEARQAYQRLLEATGEPDLILPATHRLAEAVYQAGQRDEAAELFERMTAEGNAPQYVAQGLSGWAWCKLRSEDPQASAALFERLLRDYPDSPLAAEAALVRGQIFEQREQPDPALAMYNVVIEKYPQSREMPKALLRAAQLHDRLEQNEQAAERFKQLIAEHADFARLDAALYGYAWVLTELEQDEEAEKHFRRLHDELPQSEFWADATYRLAQQAVEAEQLDAAEELLKALLVAEREHALIDHALYLQGRTASLQERWSEVDEPLTRLVREMPESTLRLPAEYALAEAAYRRDDLELAQERFDALARTIRGRQESWLAMVPLRQAQILSRQNQWRDALRLARSVHEQYPNFERGYEADYLIGRCHAALGEFEQARQAYQAVVRSPAGGKTETAAMAQWMIGESYFHQKNFEQARRAYLRTEILYAYPTWQAAALLQAGKCQESLAQWPAAIETYLQLLKKYPDTSYTEEAQRRLRVAQQRAGQK